MVTVQANRTLEVSSTAPGAPIATATRPETDAVGMLATDNAFALALGNWLGAGNTIRIGDRTFDARAFSALLSAQTREGRQRALREMMGDAGMDYDDFRRFADDVIRANPAAANQTFSVTLAEARRTGIVDDAGARRNYGTRGRTSVEVTASATAPGSSLVPPGMGAGQLRTGLIDSTRNTQNVDRFRQLMTEGASRNAPAAVRALHDAAAGIDTANVNSVALGYLVRAAENGDVAQVRELAALMQSAAFRSAADPHALLELAVSIGPRGFGMVHRLLEPVDVLSMTSNGQTLLNRLLTFFDTPLQGPFASGRNAVSHATVVWNLLTHILDADSQINQSIAGTCPVTSTQTALAGANPAEYARLVIGLFAQGQVTAADGTTVLHANAGATRGSHLSEGNPTGWPDSRDVVERVFQTALMQLGNPLYNPQSDSAPIYDSSGQIIDYQSGLDAAQLRTVLNALYNRPFTTTTAPGATLAASLPTVASGNSPIFVSFNWSQPDANGQPHMVGHELQFRSRDATTGAITLFNPWGADAMTPGFHATPFPHTVVDAEHGLITVTAADFATLAVDVTR